MTDKQIIIDGVDVSGCEFCDWKNSDIPQCRIRLASFETTCKGYNCYYKHLKRKEQENKRLLEIINAKPLETVDIDSAFEIEKLKEQLQTKEQECEKLKKQLEAIYDDCKGCPTCNEALYNANLYAKECRELKQTLAKIKEICNSEVCDYIQCSLNYNHSEDFECEKTSCDRVHRRKFILEILQKISEVENAR